MVSLEYALLGFNLARSTRSILETNAADGVSSAGDGAEPPSKRLRVCTAADKQPGFLGWVSPECGATFKTKAGCCSHLTAHRGYQWRCGECNHSFNLRNSLMAHLWSHLPKRFTCGECPAAFAQKRTFFYTHDSTVTSKQPDSPAKGAGQHTLPNQT